MLLENIWIVENDRGEDVSPYRTANLAYTDGLPGSVLNQIPPAEHDADWKGNRSADGGSAAKT